MLPKKFRVLHESPSMSVGVAGSLFALRVRADMPDHALRTLDVTHETAHVREPTGLLLLTIVDDGVPLPSEHTRRLVAETFDAMAKRNVAAATVVLGKGFKASAIRSTLTALNLLVKPQCPQRTFATIGEALAWLATQAPGGRRSWDVTNVAVEVERLAA